MWKTPNADQQQNVMFSQQNPTYSYGVETVIDETRRLQDTNDASLQNFFSRPIKIAEQEWATSTALAFDFDPWSLYFENPRVINRIVNFNLLRCKLHVRFVINGNGFQYGRALVNYLPLANFDDLSSNAALVPQDLVQASQQPHIFLNPTTSTGGDLVLPFFFYRNYLQIPNSEWDAMGRIFVRSINPLKHANGATDVVTVSVFAWAEDVSLSVLTSTEPGTLVPQMGDEVDEASSGKISGPATALAHIAQSMSSVPVIGPYARATSNMASATAGLAKMFGYCRPPDVSDAHGMKPTYTSNMALTNVPDTTQKLTLDSKQELTIDPRIAGLGDTDPMDIKSIAARESYLTTFTWSIGDAPETLLWNSRVTPVTWAESIVGTTRAMHLPACAFAALPFRYWTGKMKFRFQIVCSSFHKGRLKIVYDPKTIRSTEYNVNYLDIIDIADKQDFTIEVGNGQSDTLLRHFEPGPNSYTEVYSTTAYASTEPDNGVIGVYIVNELTTPNSTVNNDIEINVYVSMGDDFEVYVPVDTIGLYQFKPNPGDVGGLLAPEGELDVLPPLPEMEITDLEPQVGEEVVSEAVNENENDAPLQEESISLGMSGQDLSKVNLVFTGESIASFRTLLKRYNLFRAFGAYNSNVNTCGISMAAFPYLKGGVAGAVNTTSAGQPINYCNTVMLHWVTHAFSGWRGSIRWKMIPQGNFNENNVMQAWVQRRDRHTSPKFNEQTLVAPTFTNATVAARTSVLTNVVPDYSHPPYGATGFAISNARVNPSLEWEMPYYNHIRFNPGKEENYTTGDPRCEIFDLSVYTQGTTATAMYLYCAAGEDFQTYFFTGLPRVYRVNGPPAA